MSEDKQVVEITTTDLLEILLHGAVYDETNDSELIAALKLQPDKTLRTYGLQVFTDANGRERIGLIDSGRVPWTREHEGYQLANPVLLTAAEALLLGPLGTLVTELFAVEYNAINIDTASDTVYLTIGVDVAAGGALADQEHWVTLLPIPNRGKTGWQGPYIISGVDTIRGNAAAVDDIGVHFRVRRVDVEA